MEVPRSLLDELTEDVNLLSGAAQEQASIALANIFAEWDGVDVEALRELCLAALEPLEERYTTLAAARGARFYEQNRRAQGVRGAYRAVVDSRRDPAAFEGAIRAMLRIIDQDRKATERYRREVLSRIDADMRRAANKCVAHNARRDPKKPKYARVPSGAETCGFCLMLSSFGFHYTTEEAAGHAHDGCDCRVVPSFGKASVKGYDSDGMYSRYQGVLDTLGGRDGIRAEWDALPREEREAYIASHGKKEGAAFQKYLNKRVSQEIETRDPKWFKTGKKPMVTKENGAKPLRKEKDVCEHLSENGYSVKFLKEVNKNGVKTPDAILGDAAWEFKIPEGYNGEHTVRNQFYKALGKGTPRLLISCTENHAPADEVAEWVIETFKKGDYDYITEVLVMADDGSLRRLKRP